MQQMFFLPPILGFLVLFTGQNNCATINPMESVDSLLGFFKPDFVFSLSFFVAFIGFGVFFSKQFWPWFQAYVDKRQEYDYMISAQRWEVMKALSDDIGEMKKEFQAFLENERKILDILLKK
jgi:hypothetical protein